MAVEFPAITLVQYAKRIGYRECAFFGIRHPDNTQFACREIWTKDQRDEIYHQLMQAQLEIEQIIGYPLIDRWIADEQEPYRPLLQTRWGYVIEGGVMSDTMLADGEAVDYAADPAVVGPVALGTCDVEDVHLFHEDLDAEIIPSGYTVAAGAVTFQIPWCRLVAPDYEDNPVLGWDYADVATWGATKVDVRCITNDPSQQATLHRRVCSGACEEVTETACIYVHDGRLGLVGVQQANYSDGAWSPASSYLPWQQVSLNYHAGRTTVLRITEDAVIRLAHSNMPTEPCGCDVTQRLWKRDRSTPTILTAERLNCPLGISDGAWMAWRFATSQRLVRGGLLA